MAKLVALMVWLVLLGIIVALPEHSSQPGESVTKNTVRLALGFYGVAGWLMLGLSREDWVAATSSGSFARFCWSLGWLTYVIHLGFAFHYYHGWSHADAIARTERLTNFGPGIYFSHLFTLIWTLDVAWWWLKPGGYAARPRWIDYALHGFMLFIIFNATLIFAEGIIIPCGAVLLGTLAGRWLICRLRLRAERETVNG